MRVDAKSSFFADVELPGGLLKGLGLSPVRFYELFPYVSEVRVLGARRGRFLLWFRGV